MNSSVDTYAIAFTLGPDQLGIYNRAFQLLMRPLNQLRAPSTTVALPVLSRLRDDPARAAKYVLHGQLALGYPLVGLMAVAAGAAAPIVQVFLGPNWTAVTPVFAILAVAGAFQTLSYVGNWVYLARGLTPQLFWYSIVSLTIKVICVVIGVNWGVVGVAIGWAVATAIAWPISLWWLSRLTDLPTGGLVRGALRIVGTAALAGVSCYAAVATSAALPDRAAALRDFRRTCHPGNRGRRRSSGAPRPTPGAAHRPAGEESPGGAAVIPGIGTTGLREAVRRVVDSDNCSGCGACALIADEIVMQLGSSGYMRPTFVGEPAAGREKERVRAFRQVCPGVRVDAPRPVGSAPHRTMGPSVSTWSGVAVDRELRFAGSSAGVLSALSRWLLQSGRASAVVGAGMDVDHPRRTVPLELRSKDEVLRASGSRYAPVATAELFHPDDAKSAFVGKPCEVDAARRLVDRTGPASMAPTEDRPILLSFFCAGVPSQGATDELVVDLGVDLDTVTSVRYRGQGWPGAFVAEDRSGTVGSASYEESWGAHLGRRLQGRCKICPDGTGGHADISVGDFWAADSEGFPLFSGGDGNSVVIARTARGHQLLLEARGADVVRLEPLDLEEVAAVQPLQVRRLRTLFGRLAGKRLGGGQIPRYRGYRLAARALRWRRDNFDAARGARFRERQRRRTRRD